VGVLVEVNCVVGSALFFDHDADFVGRTLPYAESIVVSIENVENTESYAQGGSCAERVVGGIVASIDDDGCCLDVLTGWFGGFSGAHLGECLDDWIDELLGGCFDERLDERFDEFLDVQLDALPSDAHLDDYLAEKKLDDWDGCCDCTSVALVLLCVSSQLIVPASVPPFPDHLSVCTLAA